MYEIQSKNDFGAGAVLTVKIPEADLDNKALCAILEEKPDFILPFTHKSAGGHIEFEYQIGPGNNKLKYLTGTRSPKEYAELWSSILNPLLDCGNLYMRPFSFLLQADYLYYDRKKKTACYVYIPSVRDCSDSNALKEMSMEISGYILPDDVDLRSKVLRELTAGFSPESFLQIIKPYMNEPKPTAANLSDTASFPVVKSRPPEQFMPPPPNSSVSVSPPPLMSPAPPSYKTAKFSKEKKAKRFEKPQPRAAGLYDTASFPVVGASYAAQSGKPPEISRITFCAATKKKAKKNRYSQIDVYGFEESHRAVIKKLIRKDHGIFQKTTESGKINVELNSKIEVLLTSNDIDIPASDARAAFVWFGEYCKSSFNIFVPSDYDKPQIALTALIYVNEVQVSKLSFAVSAGGFGKPVPRQDVIKIEKAFVSYASLDRTKVLSRIQGMQAIAPDIKFFVDVISLRSGEDWERRIFEEIDKSDVLYLFWSSNAKASEIVQKEWQYAYKYKGADFIEPVPLEPPSVAAPPNELKSKHFNQIELALINP